MNFDWEIDEYGCHNLHVDNVHVWIEKRPAYCDRGHYVAKVNGIFDPVTGINSIDDGDAFPRYYMNLDRAKAELEEWLQWRLRSERHDP
jgi:hypothetical protein